jgi:hypothetical protein
MMSGNPVSQAATPALHWMGHESPNDTRWDRVGDRNHDHRRDVRLQPWPGRAWRGACQEQATERDDAQAALLAVISDNTSSLLAEVGSNTGSDSDSRKAARDVTFNDATARLNAALEAWGECSDISLTSD